MGLSIALQPGRKLPATRRDAPVLFEPFFAPIDRSLERALDARLDDPFWFDTTRYPAYVDIRVAVPGGVMRVLAPRDRAFATQGHIFVLWMTVATILLTTIAILFIRNQVKAIERLANAAEAFGRGGEVVAFKPQGAKEVRRAANAFLDMRSRIQRHIDQRTTLLASVSHDLRTPLTRLKLSLALAARRTSLAPCGLKAGTSPPRPKASAALARRSMAFTWLRMNRIAMVVSRIVVTVIHRTKMWPWVAKARSRGASTRITPPGTATRIST